MKTCYMCDKPGPSKEHAPAKCFYPKTIKPRKRLITVPSCKEHNTSKSMDDEYVFAIICMSFYNNSIAFNKFMEKTYKAITTKPGFKHLIFKNVKKIFLSGVETYALQIDRERFDNTIRNYARAIHYHAYKEKWELELEVFTDDLRKEDGKFDLHGELISRLRGKVGAEIEQNLSGAVPEVFRHYFKEFGEKHEDRLIIMNFYEGFEVWVMPTILTKDIV